MFWNGNISLAQCDIFFLLLCKDCHDCVHLTIRGIWLPVLKASIQPRQASAETWHHPWELLRSSFSWSSQLHPSLAMCLFCTYFTLFCIISYFSNGIIRKTLQQTVFSKFVPVRTKHLSDTAYLTLMDTGGSGNAAFSSASLCCLHHQTGVKISLCSVSRPYQQSL